MDPASSTAAEGPSLLDRQELVADLGQRALEAEDLEGLLDEATSAVAEVLETRFAAAFERRSGGERVILRAGVGWREGLIGRATVPGGSASQAGHTLRTGEPVVVEDRAAEERFDTAELLASHEVGSGVSVVVGPQERPWGVLAVHAAGRREFSDHDVAFLGSVASVLGAAVDTERTQTELEESEERFRTMMEHSPFSVQIFDADGHTLAANPAWERLWDASREELDDYNVLEDEQLESAGVTERLRDAFAGEAVELPTTHYDPAAIGKPGRARWIEGYAYPLLPGEGDRYEVALVHHDVTDRKEREKELERVRERMEFALTSTDAVVWDWNVEEDRASFYPDAESLYGAEVEDWEDFLEVIHPEDREKVGRGIERSLESGEPKYEEVRIVRDGEVRWIEAPGYPVEDDGPTRMIGVARDITERKRHERRIEESNQRLEQFAYAASHDLQEPLRMVSSYLQLVENRYADDLDDDAEEFIEFAVNGADRMRGMIDSLLAYSRIETRGEAFEAVELEAVLEDVLADLAVRIGESDAEVTAGDLPRVEGDASQLRELLQNLVANAIEYSGDEPPVVHVSAERDGQEWVVSVRDEGIGIDAADHERIFDVFERLHSREDHPGTGIGLALCDRIVERHGGRLWVESDPGEGATFRFTLSPAAGG